MTGPRKEIVSRQDGNQRLDRWLRRKIGRIPQSRIERMCRRGEVRVDGRRVRSSEKLVEGQAVRIPPIRSDQVRPAVVPERISAVESQLIDSFRSSIIYEDEYLVAINKSAELATQGGTGQTLHVDRMLGLMRTVTNERWRLTHRLDKATSGVLLLGRTVQATQAMAELFRTRKIAKLYLAVTCGVPTPLAGSISHPVTRAESYNSGNAIKMRIRVEAAIEGKRVKQAVTNYAVIEKIKQLYAFVALSPQTGRTHQLRVHMSELGCPILGDAKYGLGRADFRKFAGSTKAQERLHLHAKTLEFEHPFTGTPVRISASAPKHFRATCDMLGWNPDDVPEEFF